jgi:transcriptional regulator with XRE-family HTH domain
METKTKDGAALRRMREMAGLSLDQAADIVGCSTSKVSRAECGITKLSRGDRALLERELSAEIRRRARECDEYLREYDQAVAV